MRRVLSFLILLSVTACSASDGGADPVETTDNPTIPGATPSIVLSGDSLGGTAIAGGTAISQSFNITAGSAATLKELSATTMAAESGEPPTWLSATMSPSVAPATVTVAMTPISLAAGTYTATIRVSARDATPRTIRVAFVVRPRPTLRIDRSAISLATFPGGTLATETIGVSGIDGEIASLATTTPTCDGGAPRFITPALDGATTPTSLRVAISTVGLAAGDYTCSFTVSTSQALVDSASRAVRVALSVKEQPRIALSTSVVNLAALRLTDATPTPVSITNAGGGTLTGLSLGAVMYTTPGAPPWLNVELNGATAPATLTVRATTAALSAGTYTAEIPIVSTASGVANSPQTLPVHLDVLPIPSSLAISPGSLSMTRKRGVSGGVSGTFSVTHTGDDPLPNISFDVFSQSSQTVQWQAQSIQCQNGGFGSTPCTMMVLVNPPANTPVGTYTGDVVIRSSSGQTASIGITVTITP